MQVKSKSNNKWLSNDGRLSKKFHTGRQTENIQSWQRPDSKTAVTQGRNSKLDTYVQRQEELKAGVTPGTTF